MSPPKQEKPTKALDQQKLYTEIPLCFPTLEYNPRRYLLNDVDFTLSLACDTDLAVTTTDPSAQNFIADDSDCKACSSVSHLLYQKTVTTSFVRKSILSVALLSPRQEPTLLQLDFSRLQRYQKTAKIQAFDDDSSIRLVLVDTSGIILCLQLNSATLEPVTLTFKLHDALAYFTPNQLLHLTTRSLRPYRVGFLDKSRVVLGFTPFVMSLHLDNETFPFHIWSHAYTLEAWKARRSTASYVMQSVGKLIFTKTSVIDMVPVAALCVCSDAVVFTLHSDGLVRKWTFGDGTLEPLTVTTLVIENMPPHLEWSDEGTRMDGQLYKDNQVYALVLSIQVGDESTLLAVHGRVSDEETGKLVPSIRIMTPPNTLSLIGMAFEQHPLRCQLRALFATNHGNVFCIYPPEIVDQISRIFVICSHPTIAPPEFLLDHTALVEKKRIQSLSFVRLMDEPRSLDDTLHQVDIRFLQYLFRPTYPRGTGSVLPPMAAHIRLAIEKLIPNRHFLDPLDSIELETFKAVHEWRRRCEGQLVRKVNQFQKNRHTPLPLTPGSLLDSPASVVNDDDLPSLQDEQLTDTSHKYVSEQYHEVKDQVAAHEGHWRALLMEIWEQEEVERTPHLLACSKSDAAMIIRNGATSVVVCSGRQVHKSTDFLFALDSTAVRLMQAIEQHTLLSKSLLRAEQEIWEIVSRGELAFDPASGEKCRQIFCQFANDLSETELPNMSTDDFGHVVSEVGGWVDSELSLLLERAPFERDLPGISLLTLKGAMDEDINTFPERSGRMIRHAALSFAVRSMDSIRRVMFGRRLLLLWKGSSSSSVDGRTLGMYVHSLGLMWTAGQHVSLSSVSKDQVAITSESSVIECDGGSSSILGPVAKTLIADMHLINSAPRKLLGPADSASLSSILLNLSNSLARRCLRFSLALPADFQNNPSLPELGLVSAKDKSHAKFAIRLLAPINSFCQPNDDDELSELRESKLAESLIVAASREPEERSRAMIEYVFRDLEFDVRNLQKSMEHLGIIGRNILNMGNPYLSGFLVLYIQSGIEAMGQLGTPDELCKNSFFVALESALFNTAIAAENWSIALTVCIKCYDVQKAAFNIKRLALGMVSAGYLFELLGMCASINDQVAESRTTHTSITSIFGNLAADALANSQTDSAYLLRATNSSVFVDFHGALFSLRVSQKDWRKAAQAMDMLYGYATKELANTAHAESKIVSEINSLIVGDMLLASLGSLFALGLEGVTSPYIISGEDGNFPMSSISKGTAVTRPIQTENICTKAERKESLVARMRFLDELEARAAISSSQLVLLQSVDEKEITSFSLFQSEAISGRLLNRGHYKHALMVSLVLSKLANKSNVLEAVILRLISDHLLVFMFNPKTKSEKQINLHFSNPLDGIAEGFTMPCVLAEARTYKLSEIRQHKITVIASELIEVLTTRFSTAQMPVAVDVAECFLHCSRTRLPLWLESLLLGESACSIAKRSNAGSAEYYGNPSALLRLYTAFGLWEHACRVVLTVLGESDLKYPSASRPTNLVELNCVPYRWIDILSSIIDESVRSGALDIKEEKAILVARKRVERALLKRFQPSKRFQLIASM
jgi:hypothetical protein